MFCAKRRTSSAVLVSSRTKRYTKLDSKRRRVIRSWLGDTPTVVFVDQPLNGEKSPTRGKDLQFCRPN